MRRHIIAVKTTPPTNPHFPYKRVLDNAGGDEGVSRANLVFNIILLAFQAENTFITQTRVLHPACWDNR